MVLLGTIVNVITIIIGTLLGLLFTNIKENYKETILQGIGLTVFIIGITMALETTSIVIVLVSILIGAIIGEGLRIEYYVNRFATYISDLLLKKHKETNIAECFVTATLIFVIGAMAILGALDSGMRGDHEILYTKSILDGFTSIVLASTLGIGVMLSAIPLFIYQGSIALLASYIYAIVPEAILHQIITEITAIGGILIMAIGLNMLNITKIRITNLLPALLVVVVILYIKPIFL